MALRETWLQLKMRFLGNGLTPKHGGDEPPLRAELFSAVQMEQHGKNLATSHQLTPGQVPDSLLARLTENERTLIDVCALPTLGRGAA